MDGLLNRMNKAVIERALAIEITHELGSERSDPAGAGSEILVKVIPPRRSRR